MSDSSGSVRTIWECVGLLLLVVLGACIILPMFDRRRINTRQMQSSTQVRGIHQCFIIYASANHGWFAGIDPDNHTAPYTVEQRLKVLLDDRLVDSPYLINPVDDKTPWSSGPFTTANYSYALLQLPDTGGRKQEWRNTNNKDAAVVSDRLIIEGDRYRSVFTKPGKWQGSIAWNDNHVSRETDFTVDTVYDGHSNTDDNLFAPDGPDDAYLIYSGNE